MERVMEEKMETTIWGLRFESLKKLYEQCGPFRWPTLGSTFVEGSVRIVRQHDALTKHLPCSQTNTWQAPESLHFDLLGVGEE